MLFPHGGGNCGTQQGDGGGGQQPLLNGRKF